MKKVVLVFAVVASVALLASCKGKQGSDATNQDTIPVVEQAAQVVDSAAQVVDSAAAVATTPAK